MKLVTTEFKSGGLHDKHVACSIAEQQQQVRSQSKFIVLDSVISNEQQLLKPPRAASKLEVYRRLEVVCVTDCGYTKLPSKRNNRDQIPGQPGKAACGAPFSFQ